MSITVAVWAYEIEGAAAVVRAEDVMAGAGPAGPVHGLKVFPRCAFLRSETATH